MAEKRGATAPWLDQRKGESERREGERVERCLTKHRETQREEGLNEREVGCGIRHRENG